MTNAASRDTGVRATYRKVRRPGHPLAGKSDSIRVNRLVLYEKIGPGKHRCEWCGTSIEWTTGQAYRNKNSIVADHLDGDTLNDSSSNLVASCNHCNSQRCRFGPIQRGEVVVGSGRSLRRGRHIRCKQCSKVFVSPVTSKLIPIRTFCSPRCSSTFNGPILAPFLAAGRRIPDGVPKKVEGDHYRRLFQHTCTHCKVDFFRQANTKCNLFCSRQCRAASMRVSAGRPSNAEIMVINGKRRAIERRSCEVCRSEFVFQLLSTNAGRFCSRKCMAVHNTGKKMTRAA